MKSSNFQAVILAAGKGRRLGGAANGTPKCLMQVGGRSLLSYQLEILREIGIKKPVVVAGHGADQVHAEMSGSAVLQLNETYAETNSLYSLWLAAKWITGSMMVINADVLAAPQIYRRLRDAEGNALAFDSQSGTQAEEMKVRFVADRLDAISKSLEPDQSHGENLGILKFDAAGARSLLAEADRIVSSGRVNEWAPAAVDGIAKDIPIKGIDVSGLPWTEIDFPEDLDHARNRVWPAIAGRPSSNGVERPTRPDSGPRALVANFAS